MEEEAPWYGTKRSPPQLRSPSYGGSPREIDWTVQNRVRSPWDVGLMRIYAWSFAKGHVCSNEPNSFEMLVLLTAMT